MIRLTSSWVVLASMMGVGIMWDCWRRTIPWGLCLAGVVAGVVWAPEWSWTGASVAYLLCWLGGFPGGDRRGVAVLGGLLGPFAAVLLCTLTACALACVATWWPARDWHETPLFPWFAAAGCVTLAVPLN